MGSESLLSLRDVENYSVIAGVFGLPLRKDVDSQFTPLNAAR